MESQTELHCQVLWSIKKPLEQLNSTLVRQTAQFPRVFLFLRRYIPAAPSFASFYGRPRVPRLKTSWGRSKGHLGVWHLNGAIPVQKRPFSKREEREDTVTVG